MSYPLGLQPKKVVAIIDNTFRVYRRNLKTMLLLGVLIGGLGQFLSYVALFFLGDAAYVNPDYLQTILQSSTATSIDMMRFMDAYSGLMRANLVMLLVQSVVSLFVSPFVMGGISLVTGGYFHGEICSTAQWFNRTRGLYGKLLGTWLARGLMVAATAVCLIPVLIVLVLLVSLVTVATVGIAIWLPVLIMFVLMIPTFAVVMALLSWPELILPISISHARYGFSYVGRAFSLFFKNFWRMVGLITLTWGITMVVSLLTIAAASLVTQSAAFFAPVSNIVNMLFSSFTIPLVPISMMLMYQDIRIRRDGYDLVLRQNDLLAPLPVNGGV